MSAIKPDTTSSPPPHARDGGGGAPSPGGSGTLTISYDRLQNVGITALLLIIALLMCILMLRGCRRWCSHKWSDKRKKTK